MLSEYLQSKLDLRILGYFERINNSAIQYAERLLPGKSLPGGQNPKSLADHFVNHYKDHGFVIDFDEASGLLGDSVVKKQTSEYAFANALYETKKSRKSERFVALPRGLNGVSGHLVRFGD